MTQVFKQETIVSFYGSLVLDKIRDFEGKIHWIVAFPRKSKLNGYTWTVREDLIRRSNSNTSIFYTILNKDSPVRIRKTKYNTHTDKYITLDEAYVYPETVNKMYFSRKKEEE